MSTIAERTNNPLNIRFSPANRWQGQVGECKGFCIFKNEAYGIRAAYRILTTYISNGVNTIESIVSRWAPPTENDTKRYIDFVADQTLIPADMELTDLSIHDYWTKVIIIEAMAKMECGKSYDCQQINLYINYPERF